MLFGVMCFLQFSTMPSAMTASKKNDQKAITRVTSTKCDNQTLKCRYPPAVISKRDNVTLRSSCESALFTVVYFH